MSSFFDNHLGFQLCKDRIRLVEVVYKEDDLYLENIGEQRFEKNVENFSDLTGILQSVYDEVLEKKQFNSKFVSYTFPSSFFKAFELPYDPSLLKNDLKDHLNWELKKLYPYEFDTEYLIQNIEYADTFINRKNYMGVVALPKPLITALVKFSKANNLSIKYIDHPQTASNVFLKMTVDEFSVAAGMSIYVGSDSLSVMLLSNGIPVFMQQLSFKTKEEIDSNLKKILDNIIENDVDLSQLGYACISGESITDELTGNLSDAFGLQIKAINPFEKIKMNPDSNQFEEFQGNASAFAAPAGLALRLM